MRERPPRPRDVATDASIEAVIEAGPAAIAAGAIEPGVTSLRSAVALADAAGTTHAPGPVAAGPGARR